MSKKEKELEKTDVIDEVDSDEADVTRNINLDDLYDGAVNNTVVIDPVTDEEVLMTPKKTNYTLLFIVVLIITFLALYYLNNKSNWSRTNKDVAPVTTTTTTQNVKKGTITCSYQSKSDNETEDAMYTIDYENNKVVKSNFTYTVVITSDVKSAVELEKESEYEKLYTNNSSIKGMNSDFSKTNKGFSFETTIDYKTVNFDQISIEDSKTVLFIRPKQNDTVSYINFTYDAKGYTCSTKEDMNEK